MVLQVGSHDFLIGRIDGSKLPRIFHANAVPLDRIVHIDYHSHLWTTGTDMSRWNHCGIECVALLGNGRHLEYERLGGNLIDGLRTGIILIFQILMDVGRDFDDDIFLVVNLDEITELQSGPCRVIIDVDNVLLCYHLASQNGGVLLGTDNGLGLREQVQRLLVVLILLVEHRDVFLLFLEIVVIELIVILAY